MPTAPLDNLEQVINTARVRLNDAIAALSGDVLKDATPFTLVMINAAWRRLQELLVNFGYTWLKNTYVQTAVAIAGSTDTAAAVWFDWTGYNNGALLGTPILPQDCIAPLSMEERVNGTNGIYLPMDRLDNGLPGVPKLTLNKVWEWRNGKIYMPGATGLTDIRLRYAAFYADFVAPGTTAFTAQNVPILRSLNAFAWFICSEAAKSRGDLDAGDFDSKAQLAAQYIFNLDPLQARSITAEAGYGKMPDQYTPTLGPAGPRGQQNG